MNVDTSEWRALVARVGQLEAAMEEHSILHEVFYPWPWQPGQPAPRAGRPARRLAVVRPERVP
jgi:hypothetical protein